jgi:hypothetical protein
LKFDVCVLVFGVCLPGKICQASASLSKPGQEKDFFPTPLPSADLSDHEIGQETVKKRSTFWLFLTIPAHEVAHILNLPDRRIVWCSLSVPLAGFNPHSPQFSASQLLLHKLRQALSRVVVHSRAKHFPRCNPPVHQSINPPMMILRKRRVTRPKRSKTE